MMLQWISVALTLSGTIVWFSGGNQALGYGIFMTGGVMWLVLQRLEKRNSKMPNETAIPTVIEKTTPRIKAKSPRQSDSL